MEIDKLSLILGGVACGAIGIMGGVSLAAGFTGYHTLDAKIIEQENKPAVMRIYREGADSILIQDQKDKNHYKVLDTYLNTIEDSQERNAEEIRIKKLVGWDD